MTLGTIGKKTRVTMTKQGRQCLVLNTRSCCSAECLTRFESHAQWATLTWSLVQRNSKLTSQDSTAQDRPQRAHRPRMLQNLWSWTTPQACSVSTPPTHLVIQAQGSRNRRKTSREPPCSAQSRRKRRPVTANESLRELVKPHQVLSFLGRMDSKSTLPSIHIKVA
jgi:hypothetical protein